MHLAFDVTLYILRFFWGNFLLKILIIGNLLQNFHASTGGRYGTLAALCRSPSLRAIGAAMPGVSNSVSVGRLKVPMSPSPRHHDMMVV